MDGYAAVYALIRNHTPSLRAHPRPPCSSTRRGGARKQRLGPHQRQAAPQQSAARRPPPWYAVTSIVPLICSYLAFMLLLPIIMGLLTKAIEARPFAVLDLHRG